MRPIPNEPDIYDEPPAHHLDTYLEALAPLEVGQVDAPAPIDQNRLMDGGRFLFDQPDGIPAIWGDGEEVLWSDGEALWFVGPPGVGKTTMVGQLVRGRLGLSSEVLGWPVKPSTSKTLYLAMDRPAQIARALRRNFTPDERDTVADRLTVWKGPPPADVARHPGVLLDLCRQAGADTVVIDSVKDAAIKLTDDEVGAAFNRAVQSVTVEGFQVLALHHQRKGQAGSKPTTLADVYGSTWLTAGAGSVILLWGEAGDPIVELMHLKQPANPIGPLKIEHDHHNGTSSIVEKFDPLQWLRHRRSGGTAAEAARQMFTKHEVTDADRKRAERKLQALVRAGLARVEPAERGGPNGTQPARFYALQNDEMAVR